MQRYLILLSNASLSAPKRAVGGGRTRDLRLGKPTLYQLSYYRMCDMLGKDTYFSKTTKYPPLAVRGKSFLLEGDCYYPSNRFLSYWKHFATIRQIFLSCAMRKKAGVLSIGIALIGALGWGCPLKFVASF